MLPFGKINHKIKYAITTIKVEIPAENIPKNARKNQTTLIKEVSSPKYLPNPEHTPAILLLSASRNNLVLQPV